MGLLNYALYTTTNRIRHTTRATPMTPEVAYDAVGQALREGARQHSYALGALRSRWQVGGADEEQLAQKPLVAYGGTLLRYRQIGAAQRGTKRQRGD